MAKRAVRSINHVPLRHQRNVIWEGVNVFLLSYHALYCQAKNLSENNFYHTKQYDRNMFLVKIGRFKSKL